MKNDIYSQIIENSEAPNPFSIFNKGNISDDLFGINKNNNNINNNISNYNNDIIKKMENLNINKKSKRKILKPRDYQLKIYENALNQNSIIYVETGKGKTFISIMLMANLLGININNNDKNPKIDKKKKIIFFVCDTALVDQQKNEIENILNIEVGTIQGKKDRKSKNDFDTFRKKWNSLNIFVAIPSIVYKILSCGFINIFEISMLVFDECHHTADDHPYNKIMNEFYFFYKKEEKLQNLKYPLIYGLTASPLKTGVKGGSLEETAFEALQKLSENLDCVIIIDPDMINSNAKEIRPGETIEQYLNDDTYIEVKYHTDIPEYKKIFTNIFNDCFYEIMNIGFSALLNKNPELAGDDYRKQYQEYLKLKFKSGNLDEYNKICQNFNNLYNLQKFSPFFIIFEKIQRHIFMILENLCLDSLIAYFNELIRMYNSLYQKKLQDDNINNNHNNLLKSFESEDTDDDETDILSLAADSIQEFIEIFSNTHQKLIEFKNEKNYISDRLYKLYQKIDGLFKMNNKSKFIIFIANRIVAHFLKPALTSYLKSHHKNKKCDEIIGINKKKSEGGTTLTPSLTLKRLNEIISNFNEDKFDILIGTSAIEEGLDIQSCNAVLALVELNTPKSFIQIKGRARKSNSHFYIFTNSTKVTKMKISDFITVGQKMNELFGKDIVKDFRTQGYIDRKPDIFYDMDIKSHSKITMGNVTMFFNEIKQQIESMKVNFKTRIEVKNERCNSGSQEYEFTATIYLETDLKDLLSEFPYQSKPQNTKDNAMKMCHLYTLMRLKKYRYLDSHLKFCKLKVK